jgi:hypothetical protein
MTTYTGIVLSIAVQIWEQTFAGPPHRDKHVEANAEDLLRTRVRFSPPPPIPVGQPLSVGLFHCGVLRVCGGFCGCLRTSRRGVVARSRPDSALSCPFFSRPASRQNFEVRKHGNSAHYRSIAYSQTFKRLDGVIAWAEKITNSRVPFGRERVMSQLTRARYG